MNDLLFGTIYIGLILMLLICVFFSLFVPRKNIRLKAFYRRGNVTTKKRKTKARSKRVSSDTDLKPAKKVYNPYAVCRSMANKYGWDEEKTNRCVKEIIEKEAQNMPTLVGINKEKES